MSKWIVIIILIILPLSSQSIASDNIKLDLIAGTDIYTIGDYKTVINNITVNSDSFNIQQSLAIKSTYSLLNSSGWMEFNNTQYDFETTTQEHSKVYLDPVTATTDIDCQVDALGDPANVSYEFWPNSDQFTNGSIIFEGKNYNFTIINSGLFQLGNTSIDTWIVKGKALDNFVDIDLTMEIMKSNGLTLSFYGYAQLSGIYTCEGTYSIGSERFEIVSKTVGLKLSNYGINIVSQYAEYLEFDPNQVYPEPTQTIIPSYTTTTSDNNTNISTSSTSHTTITTNTSILSNESLGSTSDPTSSNEETTLKLPFNYIFGIYSMIIIIVLRRFRN